MHDTNDSTQSKTLNLIEKLSKSYNANEHNLDDDLLESGALDSFDYMEFILSVEQEFDFIFTDDEQLDSRVRSINGIVELITEKLSNSNG